MTLIDTIVNVDQLWDCCEANRPDIVLLAPNVDNPPFKSLINSLQECCPTAPILILIENPNDGFRQLGESHVAGAISKCDSSEQLIEAIQSIVEGRTWVSPSLLPTIIEMPNSQQTDNLTEREAEVLQLVANEKTDKEIASDLGITTRTVRFHLESIHIKLGSATRTGAVAEAIRRNLIQ